MRADLLVMMSEMREQFALFRKEILALKSDVISLENQNYSRHGEILNLRNKIEGND